MFLGFSTIFGRFWTGRFFQKSEKNVQKRPEEK